MQRMGLEARNSLTEGEFTLQATLRVGPYTYHSTDLRLSDSWVNNNANHGAVDRNVATWLDDLARKAIATGAVATTKSKANKK